MVLAPLRKKRATDEVYDSLRAAILDRSFIPGERLLADQLCHQLGVSLTPVRHALQQLAVEGLVEIHPRSGTYVASISEEDLIETFEIRIALELLAARRAISKTNDTEIKKMASLLAALAKPVRNQQNLKQHEANNLAFHFTIFDLAGSRKLRDLYDSLNAHIQIARIHSAEGPSFPSLRQRLTQEQAEHQAIFEALKFKSLPKLEQALRAHILRAQHSLITALQARNAKLAASPAVQKHKLV